METLPTLFKKTSSNKVQQWRVWVEAEGENGVVCIEHGQENGKLQTTREVISVGKNLGKSNETTPRQQACVEARARWTKQKDRKHYGLTVEEGAAKREIAPMLAQKWADHGSKVDWTKPVYLQPKLNGHRCLAFAEGEEIRLVSRQGKDITTCRHIQIALRRLMDDGDVFDGELYVHGQPINTIGSWIKKEQPDSKKLQYHVYDVVKDCGFGQRDAYLREREGWLPADGSVRFVATFPTTLAEVIERRDAFIENGYEGAILRHGDTPYESGKRSFSLQKVKRFSDLEFKIVGVKEGVSTHEGMAIFECVTPAGHTFGVLAPGTHEEKRAAWTNREQLIGKMLTVEYAEMTSTDKPVPFHPKALQIREDV